MQSFVYIISVALINCPREGQPLAHHAVSDVDVDGDLATASPPVRAAKLFRSAELAPCDPAPVLERPVSGAEPSGQGKYQMNVWGSEGPTVAPALQAQVFSRVSSGHSYRLTSDLLTERPLVWVALALFI